MEEDKEEEEREEEENVWGRGLREHACLHSDVGYNHLFNFYSHSFSKHYMYHRLVSFL